MDVVKFQRENGINGKACVEALREIYPNYNKSTHSMVTQPDKYGVRLTAPAEALLRKRFGKRKPKVARKKTNRIEIRVDDSQLKKMKETMSYLGCGSTQEFVSMAISQLMFEERL